MAKEYRATIANMAELSSATRCDDNLAIAIYEAVKHSGTITITALLQGLAASAIIEGDVDDDIADRCRKFLAGAQVPINQRDHVLNSQT